MFINTYKKFFLYVLLINCTRCKFRTLKHSTNLLTPRNKIQYTNLQTKQHNDLISPSQINEYNFIEDKSTKFIKNLKQLYLHWKNLSDVQDEK
jgi:hypothetical protein